MNIYNTSNTSGNTYPTNATFTNLGATNLEVLSSFSIAGAQKGDILICEDTTNDIGALELGPQNYVLVSDKNNSDLPLWDDSVTLNIGQFNELKLVGVNAGDLLAGSGANQIGRLPLGLANQVLFSNGTELGWQYLSDLNNSIYIAGPLTIPTSTATIWSSSAINVIVNREYKITFNAQLTLTALTQITCEISGIFARNGTYSANGDLNVMFVYLATATGPLPLEIRASVTAGNTASLQTITITVEEF